MSTPADTTTPSGDYADAYPNSFRVFDESAVTSADGLVPVRVPMREVRLSGGEPPIRLYDTSGPKIADVRQGLPKLREPWVGARRPSPSSGQAGKAFTQLAYARRGEITPEMAFVAAREGLPAEFVRDEVKRGPGHHPGQHQPPRARADDHRPQLPGEDQRQHRQLGGVVVDRRRGREAALGDAVGRRHGDGSVDRQEHPRDARVDHAQLAGADRHRADLPGAREGGRATRGSDLGGLPRHPDRAGRAGRGLLHRARRRAAALHPHDHQPHDRHRVARRLDHGQVVPGASPGELPLHALPRDLRDHARLRRELLARRRPASGLDCRRQRRGAVCRAEDPGRAHLDRVGVSTSR